MAAARSRRIPLGVAWGALVVLAWAAFTILTGGGTAHADASDSAKGNGVDAVSSTRDETVSPAAQPVVANVRTPATQNVAPPVKQPVAQKVAPAAQEVAPQVKQSVAQKAAAPAAQAVVRPTATAPVVVTDVLPSPHRPHVAAPAPSDVSEVPVAAQRRHDLRATPGMAAIVHAIHDAGDRLGDKIGDTPRSASPTDGIQGENPALLLSHAGTHASVDRVPDAASPTSASQESSASPDSSASTTGVPSVPVDTAHAPAPVPSSSSAGNSGGHFGEAARFQSDEFDPRDVWTRVSQATDDEKPSSPVADTDASPD